MSMICFSAIVLVYANEHNKLIIINIIKLRYVLNLLK